MNIQLVRRYLAAWIVLLLSLGLAALVSKILLEQSHRAGQQQFELQVQGVVDDIEARMRRQQNILLGGAGLIDANDKMISRAQWRTYVERLNLKENYPGIQGVGFSLVIQPKDLPAHIAAVRAEGFPEYTVRPPGERPIYTSIVYLEPFAGRNLAAFGFDMFSEATRRAAMTRATETGNSAISGKVKLVQENKGKVQAGFLMYVPVYRKNMAVDTPEARWRAILGFVYSPYRINDLMQGILGDVHTALDFTIHDGTEVSADTLMYASAEDHKPDPVATPRFTAQRRIDFYGHTWTTSFHSRPAFDAQFDNTLAWVVLALGSVIGVALFALTASLTGRKEKALALAQTMTSQLRESEQRFRHILETSPTAARIALTQGRDVVFSNHRYAVLLNLRPDQVNGLDPSSYYADRVVYEDILAHLDRNEPVLDRLVELNIPGAGTKWTLASYFKIEYEGKNAVLGWFHDITDRKLAEIALNEQAERTQTILDNAVDGIITIDKNGIVSSMNKSAEHIFGYKPDEVIGQNIKMLMPEPYRSAHDGYLHNYVTTGKAKIIGIGREVVGQRKNGEQFPMDLSVSEISHQNQRMFVGLVRDISERKQAEKHLQEKQQLLDSVIENVPAMIFLKQAEDLRFVLFNKAGQEMLGYSQEELLGKNDFDFFPKEQAEFFTEKDRRALEQGYIDIAEELVDTRYRGQRILHTQKIALHDENGTPRYLLGIAHDITERKIAEQALQESSQQLEEAQRIARIGSWSLDLVSNKLIWSDEIFHIFELDKEGFKPSYEAFLNLVHPEDRELVSNAYSNSLTSKQPYTITHRLLMDDGRIKFVEERAETLYAEDGNPTLSRGTVQDVTEQKIADRMKNEFVSTVSHELRTPLTSISGSLALIASGALGELPEQASPMLDIALKNSKLLASLINDLLDMEKIAAGKLSFDLKAQPLQPLLEHAIEANKAYADQHGVEFKLSEPASDIKVLIDSQRLIQVLSNFLSNAAKFSPKGGSVEVTTRGSDGRVRVSVIDHGPGIPDEFRERIFQKFTQADSSDTRQKGGTGLGLAISKELIERMGGEIGFESEQGQGATFYFELPIHD